MVLRWAKNEEKFYSVYVTLFLITSPKKGQMVVVGSSEIRTGPNCLTPQFVWINVSSV